jgi:hypothetical protein
VPEWRPPSPAGRRLPLVPRRAAATVRGRSAPTPWTATQISRRTALVRRHVRGYGTAARNRPAALVRGCGAALVILIRQPPRRGRAGAGRTWAGRHHRAGRTWAGVRRTLGPAGRPAAAEPVSCPVLGPGPGPIPGTPAAGSRLVGGLGGALGGVPGPGQAERGNREESERFKGEDQIAADLTVGDIQPPAAWRQAESLGPAVGRCRQRGERAAVQGGGPAAGWLGEHQSPAGLGRGRS